MGAVTALLPGYEFVDLGPDGGAYDETAHPKVELHTTEGSRIEAAEAAFRPYPPHIGLEYGRRIKRQYVRLDRHSYSNKGSESDDEYVIQVEIVGFAGQTHDLGDDELAWLGASIVEICAAVGAPLVGPPQGFHGADEGIRPYLASSTSPIRFSAGAFRAFSGICGHQHIPAPDTHWDPGRFPLERALALAGQAPHLPPPPVVPAPRPTPRPTGDTYAMDRLDFRKVTSNPATWLHGRHVDNAQGLLTAFAITLDDPACDPGGIDGAGGPATRRAVHRFQEVAKYLGAYTGAVDDDLGPATWRALIEA